MDTAAACPDHESSVAGKCPSPKDTSDLTGGTVPPTSRDDEARNAPVAVKTEPQTASAAEVNTASKSAVKAVGSSCDTVSDVEQSHATDDVVKNTAFNSS